MGPILITGGAGFIGGNFALMAMARGERVINLDALTYAGNRATLAALEGDTRHILVEGRIEDGALVRRLLAEHRPRALINFAAESHVDRSIEDPGAFLRTNVTGTLTLLDASLDYWKGLPPAEKEAFRYFQISTDEVYGSIPVGKFTEESRYEPNSPYSASKASADHFVRAYRHTFGLPTLITVCTNNYGPFQFPEKLIPLMILNALAGKKLPVYGDGRNVRDWLHVDDHCRAIFAVLAKGRPGETYNVGPDNTRENIEIVETLCDLVDQLAPTPGRRSRDLIAFVADRPGHDRRYAVDAGKLRRETGWMPEVEFRDGLGRTVRWYLENRAWWQDIQSGKYRGERLGLGKVVAA
ncbi:MAG: dTDP-glucose 4,6-dehydratase [Alphaproteobacteria bacterium]|nr:dTDP-glucose 4,6-dehydratase [Alphaproteobacteria bacterium]